MLARVEHENASATLRFYFTAGGNDNDVDFSKTCMVWHPTPCSFTLSTIKIMIAMYAMTATTPFRSGHRQIGGQSFAD